VIDASSGALPFCTDVGFEDGRLTYTVALPWFGQLLRPFLRLRAMRVERAMRAGHRLPGAAVWGPPAPMDEAAYGALATACLLSLLIGYGGALLTQTNAYAAKVYTVSDGALGVGLAIARAGVAPALVLGLMADRWGRRSFIARGVIVHLLLVGVTGLAPTFAIFIAGHTLVRAMDTALGVALAVLIAESIPAADRAYAVALVGVVGGFGIFLASLTLPVAAAGRTGLMIVHLLQLLALPVALRVSRHLRESSRYLSHSSERPRLSEFAALPYRRNLLKAGGALLCVFVFLGPATELTNRYLDTERHFSPGRIVLYLIVSSLPFLPMTVVGSRQADLRGRKPVAVAGIVGATAAYVALFLVGAPWIWALGPLGSAFAAPGYAAASVYATELFPTRLRATAGTLLQTFGVVGAAIGLICVGALSSSLGTGHSIACLGVFTIAAAVIVVGTFPETARKSLEVTSGELPSS
jgi:MFS family permease